MDYIINKSLNIVSVLTDIIFDACGNTGVYGFRSKQTIDKIREQYQDIRFVLPDDYLTLSKNNEQYWSSPTIGCAPVLDAYIKDQQEWVRDFLTKKML